MKRAKRAAKERGTRARTMENALAYVQELNDAWAELDQIRARIDRATDDYAWGRTSAEDAGPLAKALNKEAVRLTAKINRLLRDESK